MKWPKDWLDLDLLGENLVRFMKHQITREQVRNNILAMLEYDNALKNPPQPKEYFICTACLKAWITTCNAQHSCHHPNPELLRVREITDESI